MKNNFPKRFAWSEAGTVTGFDQSIWAEQLKALAPVFQPKETLASSQAPVPLLNITIPEEIKQHQHSLSLYNDTILLIKKMSTFPLNIGDQKKA